MAIGTDPDRSAPVRLGHVVETQRIEVRVAGEALAHELIERVGELNRARLLPVIERVFDEFDRPGSLIRIDRLDLDLGRIAEGRLGDVEERLADALRQALRRMLPPDGAPSPSPPASDGAQAAVMPTGVALVDALGYYLGAGTWPYRSGLDAATSPASLVDRLLDEAPDALAAMLRGRHRSEVSVRRLVRQMPEALLEQLLNLLDPESAPWIVAYIAETLAAHAAAPIVPEPPEAFARTLWFVVLRDALHRAGLRANRRAFVEKVIADLAAAAGLPAETLLHALLKGLAASPAVAKGDASLLSILTQIGEESAPRLRASGYDGKEAPGRRTIDDPVAALAALERALARPSADRSDYGALVDALSSADPAGLRRVLRRASALEGHDTVQALVGDYGIGRTAELILPPHLATAAAGLIRIARCDAAESAMLLKGAAALPVSAPAAFAVADLARLLASHRGTTAADLRERLHADASAAGGEDRARLAPALAEAFSPVARHETAAMRRERAFDLLRALLSGSLAKPPSDAVETALSSLAGVTADAIRAKILSGGALSSRAATGLSRLGPGALVRLIALLAPRGGSRADLRAALADAGSDRARLAAVASALLASGEERRGSLFAARLIQATQLDRGDEARALFLLVRTDPVVLIRRWATKQPAGAALRALWAIDPAQLALLFGALPESERREAEAMARLLSGPAARRGLSPGLVIDSLIAAANAAVSGRGRESIAAIWRAELLGRATKSERRVLDRLLPSFAHASRRAPRQPASLPEPGSAAWLMALLEAPADEVRRGLRLLRSPAFRRSLARGLPRHILTRLLFAARPREARALLASAELARSAFAAEGRGLAPERLWEALLGGVASPPGAAVGGLVARLLPADQGDEALAAALLARARAAGQAPLAAAIEETVAARARARGLKAAAPPPPAPAAAPDHIPFGESEAIAVRNAGIVLAAPFLPILFKQVGLTATAPDGRTIWVEPEAAGRGVHLLQYLVDGRTDAPEPLLALNKILCGLDPSWPALPSIELTALEHETCNSLLEAMLASWPLMTGSSVAALRETFFQRDGGLARTELGWKLEVERKTLDVLMEGLPWSFSMILQPWMPEPLSVDW